jgi:hypothetical protein
MDDQHLKSTINHMLKVYHNTTIHKVKFIDNDITNLQRSNLIIDDCHHLHDLSSPVSAPFYEVRTPRPSKVD